MTFGAWRGLESTRHEDPFGLISWSGQTQSVGGRWDGGRRSALDPSCRRHRRAAPHFRYARGFDCPSAAQPGRRSPSPAHWVAGWTRANRRHPDVCREVGFPYRTGDPRAPSSDHRPRRDRGRRVPRPGLATRSRKWSLAGASVPTGRRPSARGAHVDQCLARHVQPPVAVRECARARAGRRRRNPRIVGHHRDLLRVLARRGRILDRVVPALVLADRAAACHRDPGWCAVRDPRCGGRRSQIEIGEQRAAPGDPALRCRQCGCAHGPVRRAAPRLGR